MVSRWLGAHDVDRERAYAVLRVLGVVLVLWSLGAGVFLLAGGAGKLAGPTWLPLLQFTHDYVVWSTVPLSECYLVVGGALALAGILGVAGLQLELRWLSLVSCVLDAIWCGYVTVFLGLAHLEVAGGANFAVAFGILATAMSMLRFLLLVDKPDPHDPANTLRLHL